MEEIKIYDAISRIDDDLLNRSLSRRSVPRGRSVATALCAVLAIAVCVVLTVVLPIKNEMPQATADPTAPAVIRESDPDAFVTDGTLGEGTFESLGNGRTAFVGIRFYRNSNSSNSNMICDGNRNCYVFDGGKFTDTGMQVADQQFFSAGSADGYTYVGGVFHCDGRDENGVFRLDLTSGNVEKMIDCGDKVSSVAVDGSRVYYATYNEEGSTSVFCLKCADLTSGTIRVIHRSDEYIRSLKIIDGALYFGTPDAVCRIDGDTGLHRMMTGDVRDFRDFTVYGDHIFVLTLTTPGGTVYEFGTDGTLLGSVSEPGLFFSGASCDELTVYNGKVVAFDNDGFYLVNVVTGDRRMIAAVTLPIDSTEWSQYPEFYYVGVSKTTYNGNLYFNYGSNILEYSPEGTRIYKLSS